MQKHSRKVEIVCVNVPDLRLESHVEHAVRLVEDDVGDLFEGERTHLHHVDESPGGGDHHGGVASQVLDLKELGLQGGQTELYSGN